MPPKSLRRTKFAVRAVAPLGRLAVLAMPLLSSVWVSRVVVPSLKVTVPVGWPPAGETTLTEVRNKLRDLGLHLGMRLPSIPAGV